MLTEYHCHILPGIDDGSENAEMSIKMVEMMHTQGVERICATPHFYAHREKSIADYIKKRQDAFDAIKDKLSVSDIRLGAEIAVEQGISEMKDIEKLAIDGTNIILLELPYRPYAKWMSEEIYNISAEFGLRIMLAHVHRYLEYYSKEEIETVLSTNAILQLNNEAFSNWHEKRIAKTVLSEHTDFAFGSDAHNISTRKPNWDLLKKKVKEDVISVSDSMLDKYSL